MTAPFRGVPVGLATLDLSDRELWLRTGARVPVGARMWTEYQPVLIGGNVEELVAVPHAPRGVASSELVIPVGSFAAHELFAPEGGGGLYVERIRWRSIGTWATSPGLGPCWYGRAHGTGSLPGVGQTYIDQHDMNEGADPAPQAIFDASSVPGSAVAVLGATALLIGANESRTMRYYVPPGWRFTFNGEGPAAGTITMRLELEWRELAERPRGPSRT